MSPQEWVFLCKQAVYSWLADRAPTMGAAIAYYTVFSLAPMLVMVIAVAGLAFGQKAAEGALFGELSDLVGPESAGAVQAMLRNASSTRSGIIATAVGIGTLEQTFREHCERLESAEHEMRDRLAYTPYGEERERLQYRLGEIHQERERCWRR